jgi:hypothetical protein
VSEIKHKKTNTAFFSLMWNLDLKKKKGLESRRTIWEEKGD